MKIESLALAPCTYNYAMSVIVCVCLRERLVHIKLVSIYANFVGYFNIWILTIPEHIISAATCPRTIIKYLVYKCVRTLVRRFSSNIYVISAQF